MINTMQQIINILENMYTVLKPYWLDILFQFHDRIIDKLLAENCWQSSYNIMIIIWCNRYPLSRKF